MASDLRRRRSDAADIEKIRKDAGKGKSHDWSGHGEFNGTAKDEIKIALLIWPITADQLDSDQRRPVVDSALSGYHD